MKAFPGSRQIEQGMDLRDYFAANAMQAIISNYKEMDEVQRDCYCDEEIARRISVKAYSLADAMMEARKK